MPSRCNIGARPGSACRGRVWCSDQRQRRHGARLHVVAGTRADGHSKGAVLILPAFLSGSAPYTGMAASLRTAGFAADTMPLTLLEWAPVLSGSDFSFYLQRADAALKRLAEQYGSVALVGHSAGGWLARILLGEVPYQGVRYGRHTLVHSLLTLGSPHLSIEQYPFGRADEALQIDDPGVPAAVRGSSLKFANYYYPRGDAFDGVRITCAVGNSIRGRDLWGRQSLPEASSSGGDGLPVAWQAPADGTPQPSSRWDEYFAYEGYKSGCGRGDVDGDGVTPICIAQLPGAAENVVLGGVWHQPRRRAGQLWYGDDVVVKAWQHYLCPDSAENL